MRLSVLLQGSQATWPCLRRFWWWFYVNPSLNFPVTSFVGASASSVDRMMILIQLRGLGKPSSTGRTISYDNIRVLSGWSCIRHSILVATRLNLMQSVPSRKLPWGVRHCDVLFRSSRSPVGPCASTQFDFASKKACWVLYDTVCSSALGKRVVNKYLGMIGQCKGSVWITMD